MSNGDAAELFARACGAAPGRRWRVLAHDGARDVEMENSGVFDELVVDHWLHVEQMGERDWWLRVGDARMLVRIDEAGGVALSVERNAYAD